MVARRSGHRRDGTAIKRNCDPDDILLCAERLLHAGRLAPVHSRVMGKWGLLGFRPSMRGAEREAGLVWSEAMAALDAALIQKNIVFRRQA